MADPNKKQTFRAPSFRLFSGERVGNHKAQIPGTRYPFHPSLVGNHGVDPVTQQEKAA
jgi:hypothetical protein